MKELRMEVSAEKFIYKGSMARAKKVKVIT